MWDNGRRFWLADGEIYLQQQSGVISDFLEDGCDGKFIKPVYAFTTAGYLNGGNACSFIN